MDRPSQRFDRQLFTLKLSELSHRMQTKSVGASRKTSGQILLNMVDGELALLPGWLKGVDQICREVWQIQGESVTPEFVRDILVPEAMTLIGARQSTVSAGVTSAATRMRMAEDPYPAQHHLAMEFNRLKGEVNAHYEIEARTLEHKKPQADQLPHELPTPQEQERAHSWRGFENRFMALAREEQGRTDVITKGETLRRIERVLRASCTYKEHPEGWERGKPDQGLVCLLETPPHGVWNYCSDGISENFRERVRLCVAEAGRALPGYPQGADAEDFWLHRLYLDLLKNNSDLLFCASNEGGMILSVCVASATFCARLERQALEQTQSRGQKAPSQSIQGRSFDQNENLRNAILNKRARITEIERTLNRPPLTEYRGQPVHGGQSWRWRLEEETQHLLAAVEELESEVKRTSAEKYSRWNDIELALRFGDGGRYVKELCEIDRKLKGNWSRTSETALELHNKREALIQILLRDYPEAADELGLRVPERVKEEAEHSNTTSPAENNAKTTAESNPTVILPATWDELRKRLSITQKEAAGYLQRNTKTVRRLVKDKELKQSAKKRIICDEHLRNQMRKVHGPHVLP